MRGAVAAALLCLAAPVAWAQSGNDSPLSLLPTCASNCLKAAIPNSACAPTNQTCLCTDVQLNNEVSGCVALNCTIREALTTMNLTTTNCHAPIRDRSFEHSTISTTFGVVSGVLVIMRIAFRLLVLKAELGLDDWFIMLIIVLGLPSSVLNVVGLDGNGLGKDVWKVPFDNIDNFFKVFYITEILYFMQVSLVKLSILFFYLRIFPGTVTRRLIWGTVIFNVLFAIAFMIAAAVQCNPISYTWERWDGQHQGTCINVNALGWSNAGISVALDVWMLALPLSQISRLQLHWKKKLGVTLMFMVGAFVTVVSILRLYSLVFFASSANPTFDQVDLSMWSTIEINVGIICACLPSFRMILARLFPKIMKTSLAKSKPTYNLSETTNTRKYRIKSTLDNPTGNIRKAGYMSQQSILDPEQDSVHYSHDDEANSIPLEDMERNVRGRDTIITESPARGGRF